MPRVEKEVNGLKNNFTLDSRGRFQFTSGETKLINSLDFFIGYDLPRYYEWGYGIGLSLMPQLTVNEFRLAAEALRVGLLVKMKRYFTNLAFAAVDLDYNPNFRRTMNVFITFAILSTKVFVNYEYDRQ